MRDEQVHVVRRESVAREDALGAVHEQADGDLEDLVALHLGEMHPGVDGLPGRRMTRAAARHVQELPVLAVGIEIEIDDPPLVLGRLEHRRPRGVGEEHARAPVGEVRDLRQGLGADAQNALVLPGLDELRADRQAVDRARARGEHVHRAGAPATEPVLDDVAGGREDHVRAGRADGDEFHVFRQEVRALERLLRRADGEVRRRLVLVGDAALADAGPLDDPRVVGLDHLLEIGVGQDPLGRVRADPGDSRSRHSRPPSRPPRSTSASRAALMCSFSPAFAHSWATRTAFLMAFTGEAP